MIKQKIEQISSEKMPEFFIDKENIEFSDLHLPDANYAEAISTLVVVCVDMIFINKDTRSIFLAKRKAKPANDKWWVTGGRCKAGECPVDSAKRIIKRETGLVIDDGQRFEFFSMVRYFFENRQQVPQDVGSDSLTYTFTFELTKEELVSIKLDQDEYWDSNLTEFKSLTELQEAGVTDPILSFYKKIFNLV